MIQLEVLRSLGKIETVVGSVRVDRLLTTSKTAESVSSSTTVKAEYLQDGWTALMFSCKHGHERVVETLLNGGATVDIQAKVLLYWIVFFVS